MLYLLSFLDEGKEKRTVIDIGASLKADDDARADAMKYCVQWGLEPTSLRPIILGDPIADKTTFEMLMKRPAPEAA